MTAYENVINHFESVVEEVFSKFYENVNAKTEKFLKRLEQQEQRKSDVSKPRRKRNAYSPIPESDVETESSTAENLVKSECTQPAKRSKESAATEDLQPKMSINASIQTSSRPRREASRCAIDLISKHATQSLRDKMRRPDGTEIDIKQEKLSIVPTLEPISVDENAMPPPKNPPRIKRSKKKSIYIPIKIENIKKEEDKAPRSTRSRTRTKKSDSVESKSEDDDVEIIKSSLENLVVSLSDDETENDGKRESLVDKSMHELPEKGTDKEESRAEKSVYEDAVQDHQDSHEDIVNNCSVKLGHLDINPGLDQTYKISSDGTITAQQISTNQLLNVTVVLSQTEKDQVGEPEIEVKEKPPTRTKPARKAVAASSKTSEVLFNTNDPVKKRVAAIERLNDAPKEPEPVVRSTRTKTRKAAEAAQESKENRAYESDPESAKTTTTNPYAKYHTPTQLERLMPLTQKANNIVTNVDSFLSRPGEKRIPKSAIKDDSRRKVDEDVLKKKEALLNAKAEDQRRRREEKQQKAQQARLQKEKERQNQLEKAEREREEKLKQLNLEKELQKKEMQRKKALTDKKVQDMDDRRKAEDTARQQKQVEQEEDAERIRLKRIQEDAELAKAKARAQKHQAAKSRLLLQKNKKYGTPGISTPVSKVGALTSKYAANTETILDINSGDESDDDKRPKRDIPAWSTKSALNNVYNIPLRLPDNIFCRLFSSVPTSINLREIFPGIDLKKCQRQSSAVWKTPPRYSQMPKF